jgi:hypothetical protein
MRALFGVHVVIALALAACGLNHGRDVGVTETTAATVPASPASQTDVSAAARTDVVPPQDLEAWPLEETSKPAVVDTTPAYDQPPLHEPMGSTYSDVGMPYPLPAVPVLSRGAYATPSDPPPPAPFFETTFPVSTPGDDSFPETTFGPPAPVSTAFPETTFGRDGGL